VLQENQKPLPQGPWHFRELRANSEHCFSEGMAAKAKAKHLPKSTVGTFYSFWGGHAGLGDPKNMCGGWGGWEGSRALEFLIWSSSTNRDLGPKRRIKGKRTRRWRRQGVALSLCFPSLAPARVLVLAALLGLCNPRTWQASERRSRGGEERRKERRGQG
jgi:hypothetical protein